MFWPFMISKWGPGPPEGYRGPKQNRKSILVTLMTPVSAINSGTVLFGGYAKSYV